MAPGRSVVVQPSREEIGAGFFAVALEHLLNERVGLPNGQAATHDDGARGDLVATWQPTDSDGRARGEKTEPDVGLYRRLEGLDEHQTSPDPALVPAHAPRDLGLSEAVVAIERTNEPSLLELREAAPIVQLGHAELRLDRVDVVDARQQRRPAQRTRGAHALEAIEDLELVGLDEERERGELTVSLERTAHGRERGRVAQAQRGETLAEPSIGPPAGQSHAAGPRAPDRDAKEARVDHGSVAQTCDVEYGAGDGLIDRLAHE